MVMLARTAMLMVVLAATADAGKRKSAKASSAEVTPPPSEAAKATSAEVTPPPSAEAKATSAEETPPPSAAAKATTPPPPAAASSTTSVKDKLLRLGPAFLEASLQEKIAYTILALFCVACREKILMWLRGILYFILWSEKKGMSKHRDSKMVVPPKGVDKVRAQELESKVIIFIRHGESDWNYIFNKNKLLLLPRLLMGAFWEVCMFMFKNSLFIDSPLSSEGISQAKELQKFIKDYIRKPDTPDDYHEAMKALRADPGAFDSVVVSSNMRRAIATGCISMWPRLQKTKEKTIVLSTLQEMSRNVDTTALAGPHELPETSVMREALGNDFTAKSCLDVSQSTGNKGFKRRALKSFEEFNAWCFDRPEPIIIVSAGHSLWFKNFFKVYMSKATTHHAKELKMVNCGVVAFNLERGVMSYDSHQVGYRVDADSLLSLYGGFEKQKKEVPRPKKLKLPVKKSEAAANGGTDTNAKKGKEQSGGCMVQ